MLNFIERLREKPHNIRKKIALLIAISFSGLILIMWSIVIYPSFKENERRDSEATENELSPVSAFSDMIYASFLTFGGEVSNFKSSLGLTSSETYVNNASSSELIQYETPTTATSEN